MLYPPLGGLLKQLWINYRFKIWIIDEFFRYFVNTMHRHKKNKTDRWTDRQTEFSSLDCVCIPCSTVKRLNFVGDLVLDADARIFHFNSRK